MPAVPWPNSGGVVDSEDPASTSNSVLFLGLVATGLTAFAAVNLIRRVSRGSSPDQQQLHDRRPILVSPEKSSVHVATASTSPVSHQHLYQHFPGHVAPAGDHPSQWETRDIMSSPPALPTEDLKSTSKAQFEKYPETPSQFLASRHVTGAIARPPPPPPLTPPELSTSIFDIERRKVSYAAVSPDMSTFFDQPNPDYSIDDSTSKSVSTSMSAAELPVVPRRRSYTRSVPIGMPALTPSASMNSDASDLTSSSFPPPTPFLPGPPPDLGAPLAESPQELDMQGEIISVMDDAGAGWKRHTRVYGGGVCLACAASGGKGHGGFYGLNVRPEEKF